MGRPDDRYISNQDYGRRLYVDNAPYSEQMGIGARRPAFNQNDALYAQSEFKKPYLEDDYEEMEYGSDPFPGLSAPWGGPSTFDQPAPYAGDTPSDPWSVKFLCFTDPCYGYGDYNCEPISCNWVIQGYEIRSAPAGCDYILSLTEICGKCPEGETFQILFDVLLRAQFQYAGATVTVDGRYYGVSMSHCIGPCDGTGISYDQDNSDDTIVRNGTANVAIADSLGTKGSPYSWSVAGTDFSLDNATTTGLTNTLNAGPTACGSATITITACDGTTATGVVRCTTGSWQYTELICGISGGSQNYRCTVDINDGEKIEYDCRSICGATDCANNCSKDCSYGYGNCDGANCVVPNGAYWWCTWRVRRAKWLC